MLPPRATTPHGLKLKLGKNNFLFQSNTFEKYLSIFLKQKIKQEFYIDEQKITDTLGLDFKWCIAQVYEQWDFFDWHVDGPIEKWSQWAFTYYMWGYEWDWKEEEGWNLELWMEQELGSNVIEKYYTIPYKKNTLVFIFASSIAYHRVSKLTSDSLRLSIQSTIFKA